MVPAKKCGSSGAEASERAVEQWSSRSATKGVPFVRRHRRGADADAARGADVKASTCVLLKGKLCVCVCVCRVLATKCIRSTVGAAPRRRLKGAGHVARADAVDLEDGAEQAHVEVAHENALGRGDAELTCPAETELATSLSSLARAAPPQRSETISKVRLTSSLARCSRAKRSSSSGRRTGESPHTVSVMATVASPASRRCGNGVQRRVRVVEQVHLAVDDGQQRLRPVVLLARGLGQLGGRGHAAQVPARIAAVVLGLEEHADCSLASSASARLLEGVACGSAAMPSAASDVTAADSKSLTGACRARPRARPRAPRACSRRWPARAQLRLANHELGAHARRSCAPRP